MSAATANQAIQAIQMDELITQQNRLLAVQTVLPEDVLLLNDFSGSEAISQPFRFDLTLMADVMHGMPSQVVPSQLAGQPMTIRIETESGPRYINGVCQTFSQGKEDQLFRFYKATLVSWFSFLAMASNCRIFQGKTVPDIVVQVVSEHGYSAYLQINVVRTYTAWDYCVQYQETDFAFLSRLMEAEGIFYYFEHDASKHVLVLADDLSCYQTQPVESAFKYAHVTGVSAELEDTIRQWDAQVQVHTGKWTFRDFHHEMPHNTLEQSETSASVVAPRAAFEGYCYSCEYAKKFNRPDSMLGRVMTEGEKLVRYRMEEDETTQVEISGWSRGRAFCSGYRISVTGGDAAGSWLLTEILHKAEQWPAYRMRDNVAVAYENQFKCIPSSVTFKPLQKTHKPKMPGLQTAFVIDESPSGNTEEIWPDQYGRVRVRFHWDREAKYACWLRVVQPWAGKNSLWGQQWLPRVGDEVAVSFQEGDPDLPYVIGSLYNSANMPVFELPAHKTQSGIKTHSSNGGASDAFNMLRFEDLCGAEEVYVQAQKDLNTLVKNNETRQVGNCRTSTIHVNDTRTVETGDDTISVQKGNRTITVQQNITETSKAGNISVTANEGNISTTADEGNISTLASQGNISTTASEGNISTLASEGDISTTASQGNISTFAKSNISTVAQANISTEALANISTAAQGNIQTQAAGNISTKASGNISAHASGNISGSASGMVTISASEQIILNCGMAMIEMNPAGIVLNCGASVITLTPASITITAPMVLINP